MRSIGRSTWAPGLRCDAMHLLPGMRLGRTLTGQRGALITGVSLTRHKTTATFEDEVSETVSLYSIVVVEDSQGPHTLRWRLHRSGEEGEFAGTLSEVVARYADLIKAYGLQTFDRVLDDHTTLITGGNYETR